jgi:hypothetical protein
MNSLRLGFVDGLRHSGYAVLDELGVADCECGELLDRAAEFVDAALTVAGCPASGRAYIRLSCSRGLLFVEVTHLGRGTFDSVMVDDAAMTALDELRAWTNGADRSLRIERGPRGQFRVMVALARS